VPPGRLRALICEKARLYRRRPPAAVDELDEAGQAELFTRMWDVLEEAAESCGVGVRELLADLVEIVAKEGKG